MKPRFRHFGHFVLRSPLLPFEPSEQEGQDDDVIKLGVSLASSSLDKALEAEPPTSDALAALDRYRLRARGRATPFGIFAGVSCGTISSQTEVRLAPRARYLVQSLPTNTVRGETLSALYRNGSVYACQGRLRYYAFENGRYVLRQAAGGQLPLLWARTEWETHESAGEIFGRRDLAPDVLETAVADLCRAGLVGPAAPPGDRSDKPVHELSTVAKRDLVAGQRVELHKPLETSTLSATTVRNLCDALEIASRLSPVVEPRAIRIARQRFLDRFGGSQVELMRALDNDGGIAFARLLSQDRAVEPGLGIPRHQVAERDDWRNYTTLNCGAPDVVELQADLLKHLVTDFQGSYGRTFSVNVSLFEDNQGGDQLVVNGLAGSPAERLFSRFTLANPTIAALVEQMRRFERDASGDVLLAELDCPVRDESAQFFIGPERAAAIYFDFPTRTNGIAIPANDLLLSVEAGAFVLHSASLGRQVETRVSTSHNIQYQAPPAYAFLAMLARGSSSLDSLYGQNSATGTRPRVQFRNITLQRAGWRLGKASLVGPAKSGGVEGIRKQFSLPRRLLVNGSAGAFAIDLDQPAALEYLLAENRARALDVSELAPLDWGPAVTSAEGRFWNEILVPLGDTKVAVPRPEPLRREAAPAEGSWVYHRIFADADMFEAQVARLEPVVRAFKPVNWHFVRYREEAHELRLRAMLSPANREAYCTAIAVCLEDSRRDEWLSDWHIAQFVPEWSRYIGASGFSLAADIFTLETELWCRSQPIDSQARVWTLSGFLLVVLTALCGSVDAAGVLSEALYQKRNGAYRFTRGYRAALAAFYRRGSHFLANSDATGELAQQVSKLSESHSVFLANARSHAGFVNFAQSLVHMACNRWFGLDDSSSETTVTYALSRLAQERRFKK